MFYKIHYHLVDIDMPLTIKMHFCPTRTENTTAYNIPSSRCDYHRFSFFPRTVWEWNTLPEHIVSLTTIEAFKNAIITVWSWILSTHCIVQCGELRPYPEELDNNWFYPASVVPSSLHLFLFDFLWADFAATVLSTLAHAPKSSPDWSWEHWEQLTRVGE